MTKTTPVSYHMYQCSGCGHQTIINKFYKTRRVYCGVCGEKARMDYQGECDVTVTKRPASGGFTLKSQKRS